MRTYQCADCQRTFPAKVSGVLPARCPEHGGAHKKRLEKAWRGRISRRHLLKKKYGLTVEAYEDMFRRQGGLCASCRFPLVVDGYKADRANAPVVDHDHETGQVRGILHNRCNLILGHAKDRPDLLDAAAAYLRGKHGPTA